MRWKSTGVRFSQTTIGTRFLLQRNDRFDKVGSWMFRGEVGHSPFSFFSSPSMEYLRQDAKWLV